MIRPAKLISGGQTGADQGGLRAGLALGIPTGGWAPRNYRTEVGEGQFWLKSRFGLQQNRSSSYVARTALNVQVSDVTLLFGDLRTAGTRATLRPLLASGKSFIENPTPEELRQWYAALAHQFGRPLVVNVAGNRESLNPGIEAWVFAVLVNAWAASGRIPSPVPVIPLFSPAIPDVETRRADLHYVRGPQV